MIRLKNRITASSTDRISSESNLYGMDEAPDEEGQPRLQEMNETRGTSWMVQTRILFMKTWTCKFRAGKNKLLEEIFTPVLFLLALALFSWTLRKTRQTYEMEPEEYDKPQDILTSKILQYEIHVVHSNETYAKEIMSGMNAVWTSQPTSGIAWISSDKTDKRQTLNITWIASESDLNRKYDSDPESVLIAVVLPPDLNTLSYSIRTNPDFFANVIPSPSQDNVGLETCRMHAQAPKLEDPSSCPVNGYYYSSFLSLQYLVDQALIARETGGKSLKTGYPKISMQNYPKPAFNPGLPTALRILIPLYLTMSFLPFVGNLMVMIVTEKESKIKDGLRMIGVSEVAYWMSCFGVYAIIMTVVSVMATVVIGWIIIQDTGRVLIFLLTFLFGLSLITFAFAMTPFFHKPKTAASAAAYVLTLSTLLFLLQTFFKESSKGFLVPFRLVSTVAFTTAIDETCAYEFFGGIQWHDLTPNGKGEGVLLSLLFLIFDIILYGVIAVYLDNVIPNEYGVKKHPFFCFSRAYWLECCVKQKSVSYDRNLEIESAVEGEDVEKVDVSVQQNDAVKIRHISKTFESWSRQDNVQALTDISMDIYEGHITAVLGRNGAGKSTLINILTGFLTPTSGQCVLFGLDLTNPHDMARLRRMSGVCMQQDLHFEKLTVQEHLEFYGKIRGVEQSKLIVEIDELLHELQLMEQKHIAAEKLSGGQKRKLSVGIALIGSPKFILLDEPSAGVDPVSRRHIWSLLQSKKEQRVILLTTHFMDEADILADRKAIIHEGKLKCMGSSLFLKTKFGIGYYLTVELDERNPIVKRSNEIVADFIPEAISSLQVIGNEVKYGLPHSKVDRFAPMFKAFENEIASTSAIVSFGVSLTTLEEVFLKISSEEDMSSAPAFTMPHRRRDSSTSIHSRHNESPPTNLNPRLEMVEEEHVDVTNLIPNAGEISPSAADIFLTMCTLRLRRMTRNYMSFVLLIIMPVLSLTAGFLVLKYTSSAQVEKTTFSVELKAFVYQDSSLNFALSELSTTNFTAFLSRLKIAEVLRYSGNYTDLLKLGDPNKGTLASVSATSDINFQMRVNGTFLHSPALVLNLFNQYYLRELVGEIAGIPAISTTHHPFPSKSSQNREIAKSINSLLLLGTVFVYVSGALIMEVVKDREIKARTHLRVNGVTFSLYFLPILCIFCFLAICHVVMQVAIVYAFNVEAFTNVYAAMTMIILLMTCILPTLLFTAAFSYLFNKMESAQRVFFNISVIAGYFCMLLRLGLETKYQADNEKLLIVIAMCSLNVFYTPYAIFNLIINAYAKCTYNGTSGTCDQLSFKDYWGTETLAIFIILLVQIPIFYTLLFIADFLKNGGRLYELPFLKHRCGQNSPSRVMSQTVENEEDNDVADEKHRVSNFLSSTQGVAAVTAIKDLRKTYHLKKSKLGRTGNTCKTKEVLKGINFLVEEGEVFGLLGHNGAGKTTCIKMIIAEEYPDSGDVWVCGHDIKSNYSSAFLKLGYCPQHDALWDNITLQEHIELYMTIRGVKKSNRSQLVTHFLKGLQIEDHAAKQAKKLSGGTKRKLSYCMSVLGSPKIVLLDEPSTGMDVTSKRFLWNTIITTFKDKRGAILTTHAMEEADALCTRIAIMVRGAFVCIGSPQHLKSKYGVGYTLEVKLKNGTCLISEDSPSLTEHGGEMAQLAFIKQYFPSAKLSEKFGNRAIFSIPKLDVKISDAFDTLESLKQANNIEEYSFSQTTLEQVFIQFSKDSEEIAE